MHHDNAAPSSLAQLFQPPEHFIGHFGWICGYSADACFLNDAVERFTLRTAGQRAFEGQISLAVMLDPSNPQITPVEIPGVLHCPLSSAAKFVLLHAKVALLGFRHTTDSTLWRLRLIVSTGNWTRETLEQSLDLAWQIELSNEDLKQRGDVVQQACSDFRAAWDLLDTVRKSFDTRALTAEAFHHTEYPTAKASDWLQLRLAEVAAYGKRRKPRFMDNRKESFLSQLPERIQRQCGETSRNYLAMGSGFYESPSGTGEIPSVLRKIVDSLLKNNLLARNADINVFVNPEACQAVAAAAGAIEDAGWKLRPPQKPKSSLDEPFLHAKFLFGASYRENSGYCNSPWVYLGSGNLTNPGFANSASTHGGNLEAGVVFLPEPLLWEKSRRHSTEPSVSDLLPIQWAQEIEHPNKALSAGAEMPAPIVRFKVAPISYLLWRPEGEVGCLHCLQPPEASLSVLDPFGLPCLITPDNNFEWRGPCPQQVRIRWIEDEKEQYSTVPVIDQFGRVAATPLRKMHLDEVWEQLVNFPVPPDDEETSPEHDEGLLKTFGPGSLTPLTKAAYPIRQMMQFVENIAARQTAIAQADWGTWCNRLEQCLIQAADSEIIETFRSIKLNPLSPLKHSPFRPDFAENAGTNEGERYEVAIQRVEVAWKVAGLPALGGES
jgi:hypothetical protein